MSNEHIHKIVEQRTVQAHKVTEERINWDWNGTIARGVLTVVDGDPDTGKSCVFGADIAARYTTGVPMPFQLHQSRDPHRILLISPEDDPAMTIVPRLRVAGADLTMVDIWDTFNIASDMRLLEHGMQWQQYAYVFIDPIMGCMGNLNTNSDAAVRSALQPLTRLIREYRSACVMIRHFKKGVEQKSIYQGGGSVAFMAMARIGKIVTRDNDGTYLISHSKGNIVHPHDRFAVRYRIMSDGLDTPPRIQWLNKEGTTGDDAVQSEIDKNETESILEIFKEHSTEPLTPLEVAEYLGYMDVSDKRRSNVRFILARMARSQKITKVGYGKYTIQG